MAVGNLVFLFLSCTISSVISSNSEVQNEVQCWDGAEEVPCPPDVVMYWIEPPPRQPTAQESYETKFFIHISNETAWVDHSNVHACPGRTGSCSPPFRHPLREDTPVASGPLGTFTTPVVAQEGAWLILAHVRIISLNNKSDTTTGTRLIDVTLITSVETLESDLEQNSPMTAEELVAARRALVNPVIYAGFALVSFVVAALAIYSRVFHDVEIDTMEERNSNFPDKEVKTWSIRASRLEVCKGCILLMLSVGLCAWTIHLVDLSIVSYSFPERKIDYKRSSMLRLPNFIVCPLSDGAMASNVSTEFYPSIYGLEKQKVPTEFFVLKPAGTQIHRQCLRYNFDNYDAKSVFSAGFLTVSSRSSSGFEDAFILAFDSDADLLDAAVLERGMIMAPRKRATYVAVQKRVFHSLNGDESIFFRWDVNSLENPYPVRVSPSEIVIVVNYRSLVVEHIIEVWSVDVIVVLSMMTGVVSGARILFTMLFKGACSYAGDWMAKTYSFDSKSSFGSRRSNKICNY